MTVKYVGKIMECNEVVVKEYQQTCTGSAWKKVATDIILLYQAGFERVVVRINNDHPYRYEMLGIISKVKQLYSNLTVETLEEIL